MGTDVRYGPDPTALHCACLGMVITTMPTRMGPRRLTPGCPVHDPREPVPRRVTVVIHGTGVFGEPIAQPVKLLDPGEKLLAELEAMAAQQAAVPDTLVTSREFYIAATHEQIAIALGLACEGCGRVTRLRYVTGTGHAGCRSCVPGKLSCEAVVHAIDGSGPVTGHEYGDGWGAECIPSCQMCAIDEVAERTWRAPRHEAAP